MHLFYCNQINDHLITLDEAESRHCNKVLRLKSGTEVLVTDGMGNVFQSTIQVSHEKSTTLLWQSREFKPSLRFRLHLYVAITKNADRMEWLLEKAAEAGLASFTPLITHRTEKKTIRLDRLESIALSAMKQSQSAWLTRVNPPVALTQICQSPPNGTLAIAHCHQNIDKLPITSMQHEPETYFLIGPEGDFTHEEVELAQQNQFHSIDLGSARLRTETAALMACNWMYLYNIKAQVK